ncbi:glycoside hydrolase family 65 protein [Spirilliplanes yamanashiensis]|uniref:Glycosyl hydrolase n=1 Tax=Spirilliplanes yamanashiensis TaxID=42233 RepID=A0A8J3Y5G4_9ACTN|nr:glycoside hydrolase family 65 protein [Spirilliplanes yamanashiensis]MDP9819451.1 alpha,alpha-trehalose phosphorylase [Spirilliplanes yamanashiensis]GIJ01727.1 glycosyl hydrolase [Spirilliplanes yamanashiensis]
MSHPYPVEPWCLREHGAPTESLRQVESLFALANGHIGIRGTLDEGDPRGMPGTYLNSLYELRELTYPEDAYGFPEASETVVNAPDATFVRLTVGDAALDVRTAGVHGHERVLDLREGTLTRSFEWAGVAVRSTRVVPFTRPAVAALRYEVRALDAAVTVRLDSDLLANEEQPEQRDDPRAATVLQRPLVPQRHLGEAAGGVLEHRTERSGIRLVSAVDHTVDGGATPPAVSTEAGPDRIRTTVTATLGPGETLTLVKVVAYSWSDAHDPGRLEHDARHDRDTALADGFDALLRDQRLHLDDFWRHADVELDGDPPVQQAVRFGLFHVLQAGDQSVPHPVPAKGLTGNGYDGHALWDTEAFVLPMLTYTHPDCAQYALRWRHGMLARARERATELRLAGAAFPWRTIGGHESSGYWPASTAALHVNADIADAVLRYAAATGDDAFVRECGEDLLIETARLWARVAHRGDDGAWHIDGVTGPDEYTAVVRDNLFTNLMAQRNLRGAAACASADPAEAARWREIADGMHVPYSAAKGVHEQHAGFTTLQEWDFDADDEYPLLLHHPYFELYRRQVVKQADVVLAMHLRGDAFSAAEKAANFAYYEARTVRDSSLSSPTQAILAAELGHLELAHDYLGEAALRDLQGDGEKSGDGLHIASLAGAWSALVMGFGGLRDHDGRLTFAPRLPSHLGRLRFAIRWRGARLRVTVTPREAAYETDGDRIDLHHHGEAVTVAAGAPVTLAIPPLPDPGPVPQAPPGLAPASRRAELAEAGDGGAAA